MKKIMFIVIIALGVSTMSLAENLHLSGNVGGYEIEMIIESSDYETGEFAGKYKYLSQKNYLTIVGQNYGSVIYIEEYYGEKQTGTFILDVDQDGLSGWWTNGKKAFEVELFVGEGDDNLLTRKSDEELAAECNSDITGTYEINNYYIHDYWVTEENPNYELGYHGGTASFELLEDGTLKFEINLVCGPTYHIASAQGIAEKQDGEYVFKEILWEDDEACEINFTFGDKSVYATSMSSFACGFGARAYMDHELVKVNDEAIEILE